jgi:LAO/AO transport system kinase
MDWQALIGQMESGSVLALSRLISLVENREPAWREVMKHVYPMANRAATIGITGYPGSGKSTLTGKLARELVNRGKHVGVIAVDPASHVTGGALLGDRIRMNELSTMDEVFIRSMSSRGAVGGIHQAARDVIRILDAFGKDYVLVETVGVGQAEVAITRATEVVLLVCAPGQGDGIQYLKAGVMEIADIYVANKMDLPESEKMVSNLRGILMQEKLGEEKQKNLVQTDSRQGTGIATLLDEIERRIAMPHMREAWRRQRMPEEVEFLLKDRFAELTSLQWADDEERSAMVEDLISGRTDPYSIADALVARRVAQLCKDT